MLGLIHGLLDLTFPVDCLTCGDHASGGAFCEACARWVVPRAGPRCLRCDAPTSDAHPYCGRCLIDPPPFAAAFGLYDYVGPVGDAVRAAKYEARPEAVPALARCLRAALPETLRADPPQVVLPVPLHRHRLARRPVDLPRVLAQVVARALARPTRPRLLVRTRDTPPQAGLGEAARRRNVAGAFAPEARCAWPQDVLIVDDVTTTGATLRAAAEAVQAVGVGRVRVLALAMAERVAPW